ncbi:MAG: hydrogenase/urease maturation nickel metallochaperone HypA [Candidatus Omnitrophota bacterium]
MHETHLLENIFKYLEKEEQSSSKKIKKIYISFSEFGGISEEHFLEHFKKESKGTKWASLEIEIQKVPYGAELEITRLDFFPHPDPLPDGARGKDEDTNTGG